MKKLFLFALLSYCSYISFACGNEYNSRAALPLRNDTLELYPLLNPGDFTAPYWSNGFFDDVKAYHKIQRDSILLLSGNKKDKNNWLSDEALLKKHYQLFSDFALNELKIGDKSFAIALLEKLYAYFPKEYNIVANLGTGYELIGNDMKALELIRKAVAINPSSHEKSEWIHIKILEQKLSTPPNYPTIINLKITDFPSWIRDDAYQFPQDPEALKKQIAYQLHERISFIKAPDPIIAQMILDFADIVAKHDGASKAGPFYDFALTYGDKLLAKTVQFRKENLQLSTQQIKTTFRWAGIVWAIPFLAFVLIFIAWVRNMRRQSKQVR